MSWEVQLGLALVVVCGGALILHPIVALIARAMQWYRARHLRRAYLPLDRSCPPWGKNRSV
jgi:hypothetical protein